MLKAKRPAKGIVVARELHEDGTPHLHAYVMLNAEFNCTASSYWDLQGWHGNYQHAKSWCKVLAYIKKDQDYLQEGDLDVEHKARAREAHTAYLGRRLQTEPLSLVARDHPELLLNYARLRASQHAYWQDTLANDHKPESGASGSSDPRGREDALGHFSRAVALQEGTEQMVDGYVGQPAVLIDDFDETGASLHHYLKLWADRWAHTGRSKGPCPPLLRPAVRNEQLQPGPGLQGQPLVTLEALKRRFAIHYMAARGPN